jgi:hypothetical protein
MINRFETGLIQIKDKLSIWTIRYSSASMPSTAKDAGFREAAGHDHLAICQCGT